MNLYNDVDGNVCEWLRELEAVGDIPAGDVHEISITELDPALFRKYRQVHFFCGIAGWPVALDIAGIPVDFPLWTGSPPCQPFSIAGLGKGIKDARHLAPAFASHVAFGKPPVIFGEQVGKAITKDLWIDDLRTRLEAEGYAFGFALLPACGVGSYHKRERIVFGAVLVADAYRIGSWWANAGKYGAAYGGQAYDGEDFTFSRESGGASGIVLPGNVAYDLSTGRQRRLSRWQDPEREAIDGRAGRDGAAGKLDDGEPLRWRQGRDRDNAEHDRIITGATGEIVSGGAAYRQWDDPDWLGCKDGKFRPVESGSFPLVDGVRKGVVYSSDQSVDTAPGEARSLRLKGYGNAIVPQLAAEFVLSFMEALEDAAANSGR